MDVQSSESEWGKHGALDALLGRALLLDLEVSHQGKILKFGAVLGRLTLGRSGSGSFEGASSELNKLAQGAKCLLGHNLVRHDLPILRERAPRLPILQLPIIDTLVLSPICFPENPYHRLVKDYKLVRESVNDPVADARQAAILFADEFRSLDGLRQTEPRLFELLYFLLATPDGPDDHPASGMEIVFQALAGTKPTKTKSLELCGEMFGRWSCARVAAEETLLQTSAQRQALAYALTWLRVAGSNSVLPPWVRHEHPATGNLIRRVREVPCKSENCGYCRKTHNAREQLRLFFGWEDFRPVPANKEGGSLQRDLVEAGLRNESLLAVLPTGGGKSLCFQLPALVRNYRRGVLTIVISPLQALMKDQVDGLVRRTGTPFAAALYGLLTPLERGDVLRQVCLGGVAVLYVSPEQLRNRSFHDAIAQREIGCWVFDEAHCLSKWGHDFRPDYLYAGRFIREFSKEQGVEIPAIAGFTATAKRDVKEEILEYFKAQTGRELALYEGGVERQNLHFGVQTITSYSKLERVHELLSERLMEGCAIVFRATRQETESTAEYLREKGWRVERFHAGLAPSEKKRVQDEFLAGEMQVICATNAFGMGIDKDDVRLVIHADTPGSLENYLQEAGRAGRDGRMADCVLLFEEADCERQFRMGAFSQLTRRDIAQILRGLRKAAKGERQEVVITTGEILRDEDVETSFTMEERDADTKVRAAISWLERADFIQRDENVTQVFQARPLVKDLGEAAEKMAPLNLSQQEQHLWMAILREVINSGPSDHLTVDSLALLPEFTEYAKGKTGANPEYVSAKVLKIMGSMAQAGLMKRDMLLNAFVRYKVADHSRLRLDRVLQLDRGLVELLAKEEPDPEGWMPLNLRLLNQGLRDEQLESSTEILRALLRSLSQDGRGFAGTHGSIELRHIAQDSCRVRVKRSWTAIGELAEKRRRVASVVLDVLLAKVPADTPACADLLVEFSFQEMQDAIQRDLLLRSELKDPAAAMERALMYLHEQRVIILQQGLAVFRAAMTIRLQPQAKGEKYKASDYQPLEHHYRERVLQVHVMSEFARRGLERIQEALGLVLAYFSLGKEEFVRRYLGTKPELLKHATTAQSYQRIVTDLANPAQIKLVTAPIGRNLLILAGPGSGKTKTVVHRCAYLVRVERVRPQGVLVCCFNRQAAIDLRRRLRDLVGDDAKGVTVLTYHGLAMRLLGYSFAGRTEKNSAPIDFDALIDDAVKLLRGETTPPGIEPDDVRDRLLAGFQYILVDEYQDIDRPQYEMIGAIAGKTLDEPELKLSILAVGDDDQNIYAFRGTNVEFIRRFRKDYDAAVHYLVENYRSTRHIIEAANQFIACNTDRMKTDHPIRIDRRREMLPAGGEFGQRDAATNGKVQVIRVSDGRAQAEAAIAEIQRLRELGAGDWSQMAVLSSTHRELAQVRTLAEAAAIPIRWVAQRDKMAPLHQIREIRRFLHHLDGIHNTSKRATELSSMATAMFGAGSADPWVRFLIRLLDGWEVESTDAELPICESLEFLYEACAESRREFSYGDGVILSTVHSAKGTEYDHVLLVGTWPARQDRAKLEESRRAFYVGMTRARKTLSVVDRLDVRPSLPDTLTGPAIALREFDQKWRTETSDVLNYETLGLEDIHLGYPGRFPKKSQIHAALGRLVHGDKLAMRSLDGNGIGLFDGGDVCVARLSRKAETDWAGRLAAARDIRVLAMVCWSADQDAEQTRRERYQVSEWEIPVVEVMFQENSPD
ncbi:MAG: RecQ family ATP-dependent DNA helicase [Verrucomicrobiota bacterium]|jgi:ATP-dependent DNA helicase RecQ